MSNRIRIIITGGTFDKEYNELTGELYFRDSHVPRVLKLGRARLDVTVRTIMLLDSNEMTDGDRETIAKNCTHADENYIVPWCHTPSVVPMGCSIWAAQSPLCRRCRPACTSP